MRSTTSPLDRWKRWRPFGIAKRILTTTLALVVVSSALALDALAFELPIQEADAAAAVPAPSDELRAAMDTATRPAPLPAPEPTAEYIGRVALEPADHRQRLTAFEEKQAAADQRAARRDLWFRLADCESGFRDNGTPIPGSARWNYGLNPGDGAPFEGGLQFAPFTWDGFRDPGMPGHAGNATPAQQIIVAERVLAAQGWKAWPVCSRMLGLR